MGDIPEDLALFLREMGLCDALTTGANNVAVGREEREEVQREEHVAWLPSFDGEEPPF
jgi:hypothetical protein